MRECSNGDLVGLCGFFKRKKKEQERKKEFKPAEILSIIEEDVRTLALDEGEKVVGGLPIYMGIREDFDPTHSFSCASVRDKITKWRLGSFITTSKHLIFRLMEEDMSFTTSLKLPFEGIYEVEVSGVKEKRLEFCTDAGSFEFKGFDSDGAYRFRRFSWSCLTLQSSENGRENFPQCLWSYVNIVGSRIKQMHLFV